MIFSGVSDSVADHSPPAVCPVCGAAARIKGGECVSCLLRAAIDVEHDAEPDEFETILSEIEIRDVDWRLGNYQIIEEIGRGGMGVIYRARQRHSRRIVALKRVLSYHGDSRETLERFRREAEAAASLDHPNILPIYDVGEADGLPFFTMKYATGGTLQQAAPALRKDARECVRLLAKVGRAVAHAHREGILHRDLKPGNILLDGRGEPMVSDFGLAKWIDARSDLTRSLAIFGTPGFIAPEQANGDRASLSAAADVYSLGAILFDLLTGRPPFLAEHALAVIRQAAEKPAPKVRSLVKTADRDLETICAKALEREPSARYRSASEFADDLERWLDDQPVIARPVSIPMRTWRWSKRNPLLAGAACLCLLLGGIVFATWASRAGLDDEIRRSSAALRSVAVLPFEDLDELHETETSTQLTRGLVSRLPFGRPAVIRATEKNSPLHPSEWQQLGRQLGVANLLSGTVRTYEGKTRATLQLVDPSSGVPIRRWLFEVPVGSDITAAAADRTNTIITARAERRDPPATAGEILPPETMDAGADPLARDYFIAAQDLKARYNIADMYRSIELAEKSVAADPHYARAQAMLASSYLSRWELEPNSSWLSKGLATARLAIQLGPMLPEAHRAVASGLRARGRLRESIGAFISAYELDPLDHRNAGMVGNMLTQTGRPDLALAWLDKATRLEPRPGIWTEFIADAWTALGGEKEATAGYERAITFRPDLPGSDIGLARLALYQRDFDGARARSAETRRKFPREHEPVIVAALVELFAGNNAQAESLYRELLASNRDGGINFFAPCRFLSAIGFIRREAGAEEEGAALLREARSLDEQELQLAADNLRNLYDLAATNAALGEADAGFDALTRAIDAGWIDADALQLDPRFKSIRETPRFRELIAQLTEKVTDMRNAVRGQHHTPH